MKKFTISIKTLLLALPLLLDPQVIIAQEQEKVYVNEEDDVSNVNILFNKGQWEQGKAILDEAVKESPNDTDIKMLLGKYYFHHKQYDKARYELVKALELNSDNIDAKQILVSVEMESKRYSSAICYVNELLEVSPYLESLWQKKIDLYAIQGNQVEVRRLQQRLAQIYPDNQKIRDSYLYSLETQIIADKKAGNLDKVVEQSVDLVKREPNNLDYYLETVNNLIKTGDHYKALSYVDRGILQFGLKPELVDKKIALLEQAKRYEELLSFLKDNNLNGQYRVYLLEAARSAKGREPFELYLRVLDLNPGNLEAYTYVFNGFVEKQQYEQALEYLNKFRASTGNSKELLVQEMNLYKKMGYTSKVNALSKQLFLAYQQDEDLRQAYLQTMLAEAKDQMQAERYVDAIASWYELSQYGDLELDKLAQEGIFNAYYNLGDYNNALNTLSTLMLFDPGDKNLLLKRSDIYLKQGNYPRAISAYEELLKDKDSFQYEIVLDGYGDMMTQVIKGLNENYAYNEAFRQVENWLVHDPLNKQALMYGVNLAKELKETQKEQAFLATGKEFYPDDVFFKVKAIDIKQVNDIQLAQSYERLMDDLKANPYHKDLLNTLQDVGEKYTLELLKNKQNDVALVTIEQALSYYPTSKTLNYTKGLVLEKLKQYDKAYYYLTYYEPGIMDAGDFKKRLNEVEYKSKRNQVGIQYLTSRYNENISKNSVTEIQYVRINPKNTYTGKLAYTGRENGKGVQAYGEWGRTWSDRVTSSAHIGIADDFFPTFMLGGSVYREFDFWDSTELELGLGYRKFGKTENIGTSDKGMFNIVAGATKQTDRYRLNLRFNNYFLDGGYSYNLNLNANYYLASTKHFLTGIAGIGTSPDAEYIDYSIYDGISVLNTNLGLGYGFMIYQNVSAKVLGTWYNYKVDDQSFKNLYNFYFSLNVAF